MNTVRSLPFTPVSLCIDLGYHTAFLSKMPIPFFVCVSSPFPLLCIGLHYLPHNKHNGVDSRERGNNRPDSGNRQTTIASLAGAVGPSF